MANPLDKFGLSPLATADEITALMRERAEDAPEAERAALRDAWEELTLHPATRLRAAIFTVPPRSIPERTSVPSPPLSAPLAKRKPTTDVADPSAIAMGLSLADLIPRPMLSVELERAYSPRAADAKALSALPWFNEDPVIEAVMQAAGTRRK